MNTLAQTLQCRGVLNTTAALVRLGRPKFLLGGLALHGLGALAAHAAGFSVDLSAYLWGQLAVTLIQLMTHYSNDYFDYQADLANPNPTRWSGGSRVLVRGELPRRAALWAALTSAVLALVCIIALHAASRQEPLSIAILLCMLLLAWSYSSPPLRLHTRGLGEPTVAVIVPFLTPLSGFAIQAHTLTPLPLLLSLPLVMLSLVMLLTLEFPDEMGDRRVCKHSWVVLFGAKRVATLCSLLIVLAFTTSFASVLFGVPGAVGKAWLWLAPLGVFQLSRLLVEDWKHPARWSRLEFGSVALFFLAVLLDLAALYHAAP